jgi:cell division protein FtsB
MRKHVLNIILSIIVIVFITDLFRAYTHLKDRQNTMRTAQEKLEDLTLQQENLQRKLAGTNTVDFVEEKAREKLNMSKEGEMVILLPTISVVPSPSPTPDYPVWEQWVNVFK